MLPGQIIVRADALAAGLSPGGISRLIRHGRWTRLHHGIYVEAAAELTPDLRAAAALQAAPVNAVASHHTAARLLGIEVVTHSRTAAPEPEHVTVAPPARRRATPRLITHGRELTTEDTTIARGVPVTSPARTVRDLLLDADRLTAVWAAEHAFAHGLTDKSAVVRQVEGAIGQRGVRAARTRLGLVEPRSESPLETGVRLLAVDAGLPSLEVQISVMDGAYRVDLGYRRRRIGIECDGRTHGEIQAVYADRIRANALDGAGWRLLRFTWRDLMARPGYIVDTIRRSVGIAG